MAVTKEIVLEVGLKDSTAQGTTSAKQRLRELQKTLTEMALAGESGTKAFKQMEVEAGKLKDQIGDTSQRIKNLASDTKNIDTFVAGIQGITAGFQIAQGAAALFGSENEDLQKALLKVQGAMALANGVQQVANLLNKDSILITQGQAAAQALYATAVGASTGAMKAFRIALLATGIGAAIAAVGLLIAKWDELPAAVRRFLN
jgi:chromosome segregation ATPase